MTESNPSFKALLAPLAALQHLLDQYEGRAVIIGGIAASLLGTPRLTADLDAMVLLSIDALPELLDAAKAEGLVERVSNPEAFARRTRVVLLRHAESGIGIDISLGMLPFEQEMVARSEVYQLESLEIRLPTPEDLIIMKAVAHRPKDLLDIQGIIQSHPDLDRRRIRQWVTQFAELLEMPELWDAIAAWL